MFKIVRVQMQHSSDKCVDTIWQVKFSLYYAKLNIIFVDLNNIGQKRGRILRMGVNLIVLKVLRKSNFACSNITQLSNKIIIKIVIKITQMLF